MGTFIEKGYLDRVRTMSMHQGNPFKPLSLVPDESKDATVAIEAPSESAKEDPGQSPEHSASTKKHSSRSSKRRSSKRRSSKHRSSKHRSSAKKHSSRRPKHSSPPEHSSDPPRVWLNDYISPSLPASISNSATGSLTAGMLPHDTDNTPQAEFLESVELCIAHIGVSIKEVNMNSPAYRDLERVQKNMMALYLSTHGAGSLAEPMRASELDRMKTNIQGMNGLLPPQPNYVVPDGPMFVMAASARRVCRLFINQNRAATGTTELYLRELPVYLHTLARYLNRTRGLNDRVHAAPRQTDTDFRLVANGGQLPNWDYPLSSRRKSQYSGYAHSRDSSQYSG